MGIADNLIRELEDEERTGKWKSIALVIDFYSHVEMIFDTTFARLAKLTWMINDGGRPGEVHRTGKQKGRAPDNQE